MTGGPIKVLYEDADVLAVDKPEGVVSIATAGRGGLPGLLAERYTERLFPVHRLDREASGVLLFARSAVAHRALNLQFDRREIEKSYLALVHGVVERDRGSITAALREFGSGRMGVDPVHGKPSATDYRVEERLAGATLLRLRPTTGRRHQLRVHLYHIGHPIVGDLRYGERAVQSRWPRLMLHAVEISFRTGSGERRTVTAPPPASFEAVLDGWRKGAS